METIATNPQGILKVEKDGVLQTISLESFQSFFGVKYTPRLIVETPNLEMKIQEQIQNLYKKSELTVQQLWFGKYFKNEILSGFIPDVVIRYIDNQLGWGVFANRNFQKMDYIALYSGILRKSRRSDKTNAYCFEYTLTNGMKTPYTIDAEETGGVARFLNHSLKPNLQSSLATLDFMNYILLIANRPIQKGEQLCYDYGEDYWKYRESPIQILEQKQDGNNEHGKKTF